MRRIFIVLLLVCASSATFAADRLRIGVQSTGTFAWQLDVIGRHGLAEAANLDLIATEMASPDAGKLALNAGTVDIAVVDWLWVARERALGTKLQFYPYSTAVGAIMTKNDSPMRGLADLKGRTLSIAGGPLDKSWLMVQAAAIRQASISSASQAAIWRAAVDLPKDCCRAKRKQASISGISARSWRAMVIAGCSTCARPRPNWD